MQELTKHYFITAMWSSLDTSGQETDNDDTHLDENYCLDDIAPITIDRANKDIGKFLEQASHLIDDLDLNQVMHDFWLTRNGHGVGFWDGDYEEKAGEELTNICEKFGEIDLYSGDNGKLYFSE